MDRKKKMKSPPLKAVALQYRVEERAPKVTAQGAGLIAERIIQKAKESGVKTHKDEQLVEELSKLDIGENIPPELYEVVAQILIFINDLDKLSAKLNKAANE